MAAKHSKLFVKLPLELGIEWGLQYELKYFWWFWAPHFANTCNHPCQDILLVITRLFIRSVFLSMEHTTARTPGPVNTTPGSWNLKTILFALFISKKEKERERAYLLRHFGNPSKLFQVASDNSVEQRVFPKVREKQKCSPLRSVYLEGWKSNHAAIENGNKVSFCPQTVGYTFSIWLGEKPTQEISRDQSGFEWCSTIVKMKMEKYLSVRFLSFLKYKWPDCKSLDLCMMLSLWLIS